jgi:arginase family enzyme
VANAGGDHAIAFSSSLSFRPLVAVLTLLFGMRHPDAQEQGYYGEHYSHGLVLAFQSFADASLHPFRVYAGMT